MEVLTFADKSFVGWVYSLTNHFKQSIKPDSTIGLQGATEAIAFASSKTILEIIFPENQLNTNVFEHRNDVYAISMVASQFGLPYGVLPQILLSLISTEIERTKSPVIRVCKIYSKALRIFSKNGFECTSIKNHLFDQLLRLFSTDISLHPHNLNTHLLHQDYDVKRSIDLWWCSLKGKKENITAGTTVVITNKFYDQLMDGSICLSRDLNKVIYQPSGGN